MRGESQGPASDGHGPAPDGQPGVVGTGPLAGIDLAGAAATPGAWLELAVATDHEAVEAVSEILSRAAPGGTSVEPAFELVDDGLAAKVDIARPAQVRAHLPILDPAAVHAAVERAERELGHLQAFGLRPIGDLTVRVVHEADWANAWKAHFPVLRIGRRIVIRPTWRRHRPQPDDVVLALDPGMAFGTGLHPTTRLCLAALESLADRGALAAGGVDGAPARVLDVGSGSGILSIAAALLGARSVLAVDVDEIAVEASAANARRNRLGRVIRSARRQLAQRRGPVRRGARQPHRVAADLAGGRPGRGPAAGRHAARVGDLREPRGRRGRGVPRPRARARQPLGRGRLGRAGGEAAGLRMGTAAPGAFLSGASR